MEDSTRKKLLGIIISLLVVLAGVGITFAFFNPTIRNEGDITIDVTASDNARITYTNGQNLSLIARQPGTSATSYFNVEIESTGGNITGVYDIYWVISTNSFIHDVTAGHTNDAEITYSLYSSPDNSTWTPIVTDVDATALTGSVKLATNEIVLAANNTTTTKYYKFVVTYPNLPKDQSYNMEKEIDSYLEIRSSM